MDEVVRSSEEPAIAVYGGRPRTGKRPPWEESPMADETPIDLKKAGDEVLLGLIAVGNAAAITEFYNRWFPQFRQLAIKLTNSHAGEDLAQDAVVRVLVKAGSYKPEKPARAWLLAILYNRVRDWGRREGLRRTLSLTDQPEADAPRALEIAARDPSPAERALARERQAVMQAALNELNPAEREVILLRDYAGLDAPETARILGIATGTVGGRLHRARKRLGGLLPPDFLGGFQSQGL
jgi:RNA polymerase sigma-70 factor (ECF subfamily)